MSIFLLHHLIAAQAKKTPASEALIHKDEVVNYQQLEERLSAFAQVLIKLGMERNNRIAIYLPKKIDTVISLFSASAVGAIFVPVNPILMAWQVQYILNDCNIRLLITSSDRLKHLENSLNDCHDLAFIILIDQPKEKPRLDSEHIAIFYLDDILDNKPGFLQQSPPLPTLETDIAAILYTSGSTGNPKGVVLSHRNLLAGAQSVSQYLENSSKDRILAVLPFSFDYGFNQLTSAFCVGAAVVLMDYLLPGDVIKAVDKYRITGLAAVPRLWIQLAQLAWPADCSLRYFTNSGGTMPIETLKALRTSLPNATPYLMYGLTEAFRSTYVPPESIDSHQDSIGIAIPNAEVLVLRKDGTECADNEPGELVHRGVLVAQGYWNKPEKTAKHFKSFIALNGVTSPETVVWSGDSVFRAKDGYLYFIGRKDDMIKTSGYRVSPNEVEEVLHKSGLVKEVLALGISHPTLGQAIVLVLVPTEDDCDIKAINSFCRKNLPNYMHPAEIFCKAALPRNQNGKIDKNLLADEYKNLFQDLISW